MLPQRLAKTGPHFHVVAFWSRFRKFFFHSKNKLCAFPIFGFSCVKRRPTHAFIIFDFQELSNKLSSRNEQSMSTTKPFRKLAIRNCSFLRRKECISELAFGLRLRLRESLRETLQDVIKFSSLSAPTNCFTFPPSCLVCIGFSALVRLCISLEILKFYFHDQWRVTRVIYARLLALCRSWAYAKVNPVGTSRMRPVRIMSWYPKCNGGHYDLPSSSIWRTTAAQLVANLNELRCIRTGPIRMAWNFWLEQVQGKKSQTFFLKNLRELCPTMKSFKTSH